MDFPALALLEFNSIAAGIAAGDAMVKRAPVGRIHAGTVQPGHYLVLVAGDVASVQEAVQAGKETGQSSLRDAIFLPNIHPDVITALTGVLPEAAGLLQPRSPYLNPEALGVMETQTVAAAIHAADAGVKGADVTLLQLRLADGLGGKGLVLFTGLVADVEAAVAVGTAVCQPHLLRQAIIPQLHAEMWENMKGYGRFGGHFGWEAA
jgi:microcompartment protein CcmL/EutN